MKEYLERFPRKKFHDTLCDRRRNQAVGQITSRRSRFQVDVPRPSPHWLGDGTEAWTGPSSDSRRRGETPNHDVSVICTIDRLESFPDRSISSSNGKGLGAICHRTGRESKLDAPENGGKQRQIGHDRNQYYPLHSEVWHERSKVRRAQGGRMERSKNKID